MGYNHNSCESNTLVLDACFVCFVHGVNFCIFVVWKCGAWICVFITSQQPFSFTIYGILCTIQGTFMLYVVCVIMIMIIVNVDIGVYDALLNNKINNIVICLLIGPLKTNGSRPTIQMWNENANKRMGDECEK